MLDCRELVVDSRAVRGEQYTAFVCVDSLIGLTNLQCLDRVDGENIVYDSFSS